MATPIRTISGAHGDPLAEAIELSKRLKLPHLRRALSDLILTAKAQRWDPAVQQGQLPVGPVADALMATFRTVEEELERHDPGPAKVVTDRQVELFLKKKAVRIEGLLSSYGEPPEPDQAHD